MQLPRKQKSEQRRKHTERVGGAPGQGVLQQRGEVFRRHQRQGEAQHLEGAGQVRREGGLG